VEKEGGENAADPAPVPSAPSAPSAPAPALSFSSFLLPPSSFLLSLLCKQDVDISQWIELNKTQAENLDTMYIRCVPPSQNNVDPRESIPLYRVPFCEGFEHWEAKVRAQERLVCCDGANSPRYRVEGCGNAKINVTLVLGGIQIP